jgi:hypothetical protein
VCAEVAMHNAYDLPWWSTGMLRHGMPRCPLSPIGATKSVSYVVLVVVSVLRNVGHPLSDVGMAVGYSA